MSPSPNSETDGHPDPGNLLPATLKPFEEQTGAIVEAGLLGKFIDKLGAVFALCFLVSMLILLLEIILRYVFLSPTLWVHETTTFLTSTGFLFGGLYCIVKDKHIRVVLIYDAVSKRARRRLNTLISVINFLAAGTLAWASWQMVKRAIFTPDGSLRFESSGSAWNPPFPAFTKLFLLVILIFMTFQFLILAWKYATKVTEPEDV